jgi:Flp pilus assembly protein TadD
VPLGRAREALIRGDFATAVSEAKDAARWSPWSADPWQLRGDGELAQGRVADARRSYAEAVAAEPGEWLLWLDLAVTSSGSAQRRALARAAALNPNEEQIRIVQEAVRNRAADR